MRMTGTIRIATMAVAMILGATILGATATPTFAHSTLQASTPAASQLVGSWSHETRGTWNFRSDGTATLVRDSVNGVPGTYTITMRWSVDSPGNLSYTPVRNTLVGSPGSDRDEPIANPRTYSAPYSITGGRLNLGGADYMRR